MTTQTSPRDLTKTGNLNSLSRSIPDYGSIQSFQGVHANWSLTVLHVFKLF